MSTKPESPKYFAVTFRLWGLLVVCFMLTVAIFSLDPIRQSLDYHDFADKRALFEIPNLADVASNIAFLLVGILGIYLVARRWSDGGLFSMPGERWIWLTLFMGAAIVAFGSGYYLLPLEPRQRDSCVGQAGDDRSVHVDPRDSYCR